jgi:hypothetical protein
VKLKQIAMSIESYANDPEAESDAKIGKVQYVYLAVDHSACSLIGIKHGDLLMEQENYPGAAREHCS